MKFYYLHIVATNDTNGDPRNVYIVWDEKHNIVAILASTDANVGRLTALFPGALSMGKFDLGAAAGPVADSWTAS